MTKDTKQFLAAYAVWLAATVLCGKLADRIGGRYGGVIGLLVWALITSLMAMYCYFDYRREQDVKKERQKVKRFAEGIAAAYREYERRYLK